MLAPKCLGRVITRRRDFYFSFNIQKHKSLEILTKKRKEIIHQQTFSRFFFFCNVKYTVNKAT